MSCCESSLQLVKRCLQRLLDRSSMAVFKVLQKVVSDMFLTQPWDDTRDDVIHGLSSKSSSFRRILSRTEQGLTTAMQQELLRILQLCCEGNNEGGQ